MINSKNVNKKVRIVYGKIYKKYIMDKKEKSKTFNLIIKNNSTLKVDTKSEKNYEEEFNVDLNSNKQMERKYRLKLNGKRRRRIKNNYNKIKNNCRKKLIDMVNGEGIPLRDAAQILGMNYSTAKSIFRIYKLENRIYKKNSVDENELKNAYYKLKNEKEKQNSKEINSISLNNETISSINDQNSNLMKSQIETLNDKIKTLQTNINGCFDMIINYQNSMKNNFFNFFVEGNSIFNYENMYKLKQRNDIYF